MTDRHDARDGHDRDRVSAALREIDDAESVRDVHVWGARLLADLPERPRRRR